MEKQDNLKVSKGYLNIVLLLMLVLPALSIATDLYIHPGPAFIELIGKWFIFWAIGVRLLTAGLRQVTKPAFTLKEIFLIDSSDGLVIVKELGFANICFGAAGVISLFIAEWRPAAAFTGGLYMGIAGFNHIIKKPSSPNEVIAMVSDLFIFLITAVYLYNYFVK
jgi:hypothetical protein